MQKQNHRKEVLEDLLPRISGEIIARTDNKILIDLSAGKNYFCSIDYELGVLWHTASVNGIVVARSFWAPWLLRFPLKFEDYTYHADLEVNLNYFGGTYPGKIYSFQLRIDGEVVAHGEYEADLY